ncbi:MAG: hypothetical protein IPM83_16725 [Ignavibacteria bacterium]|nr:hypothetical protein [Ignavibacteria bacterium]
MVVRRKNHFGVTPADVKAAFAALKEKEIMPGSTSNTSDMVWCRDYVYRIPTKHDGSSHLGRMGIVDQGS